MFIFFVTFFLKKNLEYYEQDSLDDYNFNQRMHLGKYLALVTNYFRECISAFAESDNPELRLKVWLRFINIITLQKLWTTHLYSLPNLPPAYGAEISMSSTNSGAGFSGGFKPGKFIARHFINSYQLQISTLR